MLEMLEGCVIFILYTSSQIPERREDGRIVRGDGRSLIWRTGGADKARPFFG
jgi:hypothetical protein